MTILLSQAVRVGGAVLAAGTTQTMAADLEADLVTRKMATYTVAPMKSTVPLFGENDPLTGGLTFLAGGEDITDSMGGGGGGSRPVYRGPVATRVLVPNTKHATNRQGMWRSLHYARDNISAVQLGYANWWYALQTENLPGTAATFAASIEYPLGSTPQQFLFAGAATGSAADGATILTDLLTLTAQIPAGSQFAVYTWADMQNGIIYNTTGAAITGDRGVFGVTTPNLTATGGAAIGSASTGALSPLVAILGDTKRPTVALVGDSIQLGAVNLVTTQVVGNGLGDQGLTARSIGPQFGYLNLGSYGDRAQTYITAAGARRKALMAYCSHVVCNFGTNDVGNGRTAVQALADIATIAGWYPSKPFFQETIAPLTTSTDSWATTANQTVGANDAQRVLLNNAFRDAPMWLSGIFDTASVLETSWGSGVWKSPGMTLDGIHLSVRAQMTIQGSGVVNPAMIF